MECGAWGAGPARMTGSLWVLCDMPSIWDAIFSGSAEVGE